MRIVLSRLAWLMVVSTALVACSSGNGATRRDGGIVPGDAPLGDAPGPGHECNDGVHFCPEGFICAAVMSVNRCVPDPDPPPPGDGTRCGDCPAPGQCRMGICIQPTPGGDICEFDDACLDGEFCIAGSCTPDPRIPVPCTDVSLCAPGFVCEEGTCQCVHTSDCPIGLECMAGVCLPGPGGDSCIADADCPGGMVCEGGRCRESTVCDIVAPNLAGDWDMHSTLRLREALPSWLSSFLDGIAGPLRFLSGSATCIDFGLPGWVESAICDLVRPYVDEFLPPWAPAVFDAIADLNDVLNTWEIDESMTLTAGSVPDSYRGTHTWERVSFTYRDRPLMGDPTTVFDWRFAPNDFNANVVCGVFNIDRHSVHVSIGSIISWLVDALVYEASDHRWSGLEAALTDISSGFCDGLATAADDSIDYPGVGDTVRSVCTSTVATLITTAIREVLDARIGADPITLRGYANIGGPSSLVMGHWDGTLIGSDFTGDWQATR